MLHFCVICGVLICRTSFAPGVLPDDDLQWYQQLRVVWRRESSDAATLSGVGYLDSDDRVIASLGPESSYRDANATLEEYIPLTMKVPSSLRASSSMRHAGTFCYRGFLKVYQTLVDFRLYFTICCIVLPGVGTAMFGQVTISEARFSSKSLLAILLGKLLMKGIVIFWLSPCNLGMWQSYYVFVSGTNLSQCLPAPQSYGF
ncbi:hypothetical protein BDV34DRAFT_222279 [Aspergillus parasiticus]|uniref:Uncharacterized protein n=1 Tax=Aspergillus parasiticus TaxID=5067 RepID=A0A5N6DUF0_ASPPA|nr:hypothetical protein BDV34DRAFT_222279 [Aspergillus parasiticus]